MSEPGQQTAGPQVAWTAIENGARIFSAEGEAIGKVSRVVGDADVFTGLAVTHGVLGPERFLDADHVRGIWPDRVDVDLTREQIENLPEHQDAPTYRVQPGVTGFFRRLFGRPPR
ncbi:MAG: hypothetical protein E6G67_05415 [Actinobacteria bacterium]|nr:MAG: hypothetical protein E6G67_05415 [Actinomycetota bacterium]